MKKIVTLITTATFFAIACSLTDQFIWQNGFSWGIVITGFLAGSMMVLLSHSNNKRGSSVL